MKWVVVGLTTILLVGIILFTMVAPNIERPDSGRAVEHAFNPTEGEHANKESKDQADYLFEFRSDETSKDAGWGNLLNYSVKEVNSSLPDPETGMKNIAIEYTFEILDNATYEILPIHHFNILVGPDSYKPVEVTIIEAIAWKNDRLLEGDHGGKMQAILEFIVPESIEKYGLLFKNGDGSAGKGIMVWFDKPNLENDQHAAKIHFEEMIKAVEENNEEKFMSYQDNTNELFYKEQEVWLLGIDQKKKEGWDVSVVINDVTLQSVDRGSIALQINMKHDEQQGVSNHITYPINKVNGSWKINDLPFEIITDGPINLYYLPSLNSYSTKIMTDVKEIVDLYDKTFDWKPNEINIKLYDSVEEISASTAWPSLYGVTVPFISLKFVVQGNHEVAYGFIKHEIVHTMLADISNDNAPPFLQEGLAVFISSSVTTDNFGNLQLDFGNTVEREKFILKNTEEIKPISDLKDINYTDNTIDIYNVGFLITNYLIQTFGMEKYLEMIEFLGENDILDNDNPDKEQIVYKLAIEALELTYGPIDKLSEGYIDYYNKRK